MPSPIELTRNAVQHGRDKKRNNAIAAILCGAVPAVVLGLRYSSHSWSSWLIGLIVGLIWGNAFEYAYHRWLLHESRSSHAASHREHHVQIGTPEQAEYVALITSPVNIALLFLINGLPAVLIAFLVGLRQLPPGIFVGWAVYVITTEEVHWRIHMDEWLPPGLGFARAYHMSHHDRPNSRYNVFLPIFDCLFGNAGRGKSELPV